MKKNNTIGHKSDLRNSNDENYSKPGKHWARMLLLALLKIWELDEKCQLKLFNIPKQNSTSSFQKLMQKKICTSYSRKWTRNQEIREIVTFPVCRKLINCLHMDFAILFLSTKSQTTSTYYLLETGYFSNQFGK